MTHDLIAFLRARLDEDEADAAAASPGPWHVDDESSEVLAVDDITVADGFALSGRQLRATTAHIARHHPVRVLSEVDATRRLIDDLLAQKHAVIEDPWYTCVAATEEHDGGENGNDNSRGSLCDCGRDTRIMRTLCLIALPHADHAQYRPEWKP